MFFQEQLNLIDNFSQLLFVSPGQCVLFLRRDEVTVYFQRVADDLATHLWLMKGVVSVLGEVEGKQVVSGCVIIDFLLLVDGWYGVHIPEGVLILQFALNTRGPELSLTYLLPSLSILNPLHCINDLRQLVIALLVLERSEIPQRTDLLLFILFYSLLSLHVFTLKLLMSIHCLFIILLGNFLSSHVQYLATFEVVR